MHRKHSVKLSHWKCQNVIEFTSEFYFENRCNLYYDIICSLAHLHNFVLVGRMKRVLRIPNKEIEALEHCHLLQYNNLEKHARHERKIVYLQASFWIGKIDFSFKRKKPTQQTTYCILYFNLIALNCQRTGSFLYEVIYFQSPEFCDACMAIFRGPPKHPVIVLMHITVISSSSASIINRECQHYFHSNGHKQKVTQLYCLWLSC